MTAEIATTQVAQVPQTPPDKLFSNNFVLIDYRVQPQEIARIAQIRCATLPEDCVDLFASPSNKEARVLIRWTAKYPGISPRNCRIYRHHQEQPCTLLEGLFVWHYFGTLVFADYPSCNVLELAGSNTKTGGSPFLLWNGQETILTQGRKGDAGSRSCFLMREAEAMLV